MTCDSTTSRRRLILTAAAAATLAGGRSHAEAPAYGTTPPQAVNYRDQPNAGRDCGGCRFFIPAADASRPGHCHIVAGAISPHGWCAVWSPKA